MTQTKGSDASMGLKSITSVNESDSLFDSSDSKSSSSDSSDTDSSNDIELGPIFDILNGVMDLYENVREKESKEKNEDKEIKMQQKKEYNKLKKELEGLDKEIKEVCENPSSIKTSSKKMYGSFEDNPAGAGRGLKPPVMIINSKNTSERAICNSLKSGDILYSRRGPIYDHVGVYVGNSSVLHVGQYPTFKNIMSTTISRVKIKPKRISLEEFHQKNKYLIVERCKGDIFSEDELLKDEHDEWDYSILFHNCEHFSNKICYGISDSEIVRNRVSVGVTSLSALSMGILALLSVNPIGLIVTGSIGSSILLLNVCYGAYIKHKKGSTTFRIKVC